VPFWALFGVRLNSHPKPSVAFKIVSSIVSAAQMNNGMMEKKSRG
jgi:hypothetical protein